MPGNKTDSCLCGVFVPLKTFSRNQMHKAEGFVPHERVSGTKSSSVSPFPEGRDLGRG